MAEYIEREAAIERVEKLFQLQACTARVIIEAIPAADVRPVVRATWRRYSPFTDTYECSNCGEQVIDESFRTNFCPNCGADMREES